MSDNFYTKKTGEDFYTSTTGSEANMRQELIDTLEGTGKEIAKGQPALLRKMRKDSSGNLILCDCVDSITKEPDKDRYCPICMGEGFLWDEEDIIIYRTIEDSDVDNTTRDRLTRAGLLNIGLVVFYIRYDSNIGKSDKIIQLKLDNAGDAVSPRKREKINRIEMLWDYRADNGKLEYWKVFAHREDVKYLNSPSYEGY